MRLDLVFQLVETIAAGRDEDGAQREVDAGAEPQSGDDRPELAGLGEWLDHTRALGVGQAAVVIGDAQLDQLGERRTQRVFLFGGQRERIGER